MVARAGDRPSEWDEVKGSEKQIPQAGESAFGMTTRRDRSHYERFPARSPGRKQRASPRMTRGGRQAVAMAPGLDTRGRQAYGFAQRQGGNRRFGEYRWERAA